MATSAGAAKGTEQPDGPRSEGVGPKGSGFLKLTDIPEDVFSLVDIGFEGTGKSLFVLKGAPLPILAANLDRPFTKAHLGVIPKARAEQIFYKNLRDSFTDPDEELSENEAGYLKDQLETMVSQNLGWLKGGTFLLDGGSIWSNVLKSADPTIATKTRAGRKFNPKDKAAINSYIASFMSYIQDKGINLAITGHAAFSWEMQRSVKEDGTSTSGLVRTKQVYPKLDDIISERANMSLLMFKRCQCGRNITSQDGTCDSIKDPTQADADGVHQGRRHMTRVITNKFLSFTEGTTWENFDWATMKLLAFDSVKAKQLIEAQD